MHGVNSLKLLDTRILTAGKFFVGVSGKGASEAKVSELSLDELLNRFLVRN